MPVNASLDPASHDTHVDKGMLFCVSCPYKSRYDDGWATVETDDSIHYLCPDCGTEIATRSSSGTLAVRTARSPVAGTEDR